MRPEVSIIVPVYNGAPHLAECLESILNQTFERWEAIVVDNHSTDDSGVIADQFGRRDPRLRVRHFTEFLGQADNYNRGVSLASPDSEFVKIVEADNWIMPECIQQMVDVGREDREVGVVGAYYLHGRKLQGAGLSYHSRVLAGSEVCRAHLLTGVYYLGTPTTLLYRAEALRGNSPWFPAELFYDDLDLCFRLLRRWKFGFVHQLMAFVRSDNDGLMSRYRDFDFAFAERWLLAGHYGNFYFSPDELQRVRRATERAYLRRLGHAVATGRGRRYWEFHRNVFGLLGRRLRFIDLVWPATAALVDLALNPKATCERLAKRLRRGGRTKREAFPDKSNGEVHGETAHVWVADR